MRRRSGQAASGAARRLCGGVLALLVAAVLGLAALILRLGEGPLPLPPLARALERAASAQLGGGAAVEIGGAAIAWEGWRGGAAARLSRIAGRSDHHVGVLRADGGLGLLRCQVVARRLIVQLPLRDQAPPHHPAAGSA